MYNNFACMITGQSLEVSILMKPIIVRFGAVVIKAGSE
jgi:hypothetical protein